MQCDSEAGRSCVAIRLDSESVGELAEFAMLALLGTLRAVVRDGEAYCHRSCGSSEEKVLLMSSVLRSGDPQRYSFHISSA